MLRISLRVSLIYKGFPRYWLVVVTFPKKLNTANNTKTHIKGLNQAKTIYFSLFCGCPLFLWSNNEDCPPLIKTECCRISVIRFEFLFEVNAIFVKLAFMKISNQKILMIQKNSKNVHFLRQVRPYHSITYGKGNGKQKLQTLLSRNYDFVFTNLLKMRQRGSRTFLTTTQKIIF